MKEIYRAIDAVNNRAMEGLRVCEDIFRFIIKDDLSKKFKEARHSLAKAFALLPRENLLLSRDVVSDNQKFFDLKSEAARDNLQSLFFANIRRAIETIRTLEELAKLDSNLNWQDFQRLRFQFYLLEQQGANILFAQKKIASFYGGLYALLDSNFVIDGDYVGATRSLLAGGVDILQLRMKNFSSSQKIDVAKKILPLCKEKGVPFIINDSIDVALVVGADGVHLGQDDVSVSDAKSILQKNMIVGISTHNTEQYKRALTYNPDYIAIGPIFDTKSKSNDILPGIGLDAILSLPKNRNIPLVGIGGIDEQNVLDVINSGIDSVALISALFKNNIIENNCQNFKNILKKIK